jgi:hypothetical protein
MKAALIAQKIKRTIGAIQFRKSMRKKNASAQYAEQPGSFSGQKTTPIECPRCSRCRTRMTLLKLEPRTNGAEKHMFECSKCHFIETKYPLKSDAITCLASNVRPRG